MCLKAMSEQIKDRSSQRYAPSGAREVAVAVILAPSTHITHRRSVASPATPPSGPLDELGMWFVTSRNHKDRLTPPKGGWELFDETVVAAAQREAVEEAGIDSEPWISPPSEATTGVLLREACGKKNKPERYHFVVLKATNYHTTFLESRERRRFCLSIADVLESNGNLQLRAVSSTMSPVDVVQSWWVVKEVFFRGISELAANRALHGLRELQSQSPDPSGTDDAL